LFHHIYVGDAEEVLKKLESASISLIVTSPPYYTMRGHCAWKDYEEYLEKMFNIFRECKRVLMLGRYCVVNIGDYKDATNGDTTKHPIPSDFIQFMTRALKYDYIDDIIWMKPCGSSSSGAGSRCGNFVKSGFPLYYYPNNQYEHIIIFRRGKLEFKTIYNKKKYAVDYTKFKQYLGDVWRFNTVPDSVDHPAKFPETLPKLVISFYSLPIDSEVVLDPFLGSGTTMKVARELGRSSIGIELENKYIDLIKSKVGFGQALLKHKTVKKPLIVKETGQLNLLSVNKEPETIEEQTVVDTEQIDWKVIQ